MVIAWLLPIALIVVSLAISLADPGVTLVSGLREFTDKLAGRLPPAQLEEMRSHLEQTILAKPGVLLWISFGQVLGPVMMIALTILLAPLIGYVRLRARSVLAAAVFHGSLNAAATLAIFIKGGSVLTVGITGVTGRRALAASPPLRHEGRSAC